ncbi:hypothetical protein ACQSET_22260 [Salmonella enterica]|uniref:hypothetical protein n=1 Tax=Salmonella enterica TaxID=28901 RepID=UPI003D314E2E
MELNAWFVHQIQKAQSYEALEQLFAIMKTEAHLNYQVELENVLSAAYEVDGVFRQVAFSELKLHEQKQLLIEILDKNQLYVNASEMDDSELNISESDKAFTSARDLSVLEQLHYHTINEPAYIKTLHKSLEQADIDAHQDGSGKVEHAKLKEEFKKSAVYQSGRLFFNEVEEIESSSRSWETYSLETRFEVQYLTASEESLDNLSGPSTHSNTKLETLVLDKRFYRKAMQKIRFYELANLKRYFPNLSSVTEFIHSQDYLGQLIVNVCVPESLDFTAIPAKEKLLLLETVLFRISESVRHNDRKEKGTHRFTSRALSEVIKDYSLHIDPSVIVNQKITAEQTIGKKWYVYDNAILNQLEHKLVKVLGSFMEKLKARYDDIYLIRNDEQSTRFKLTEFKGARGFMPDFILLLTSKSDNAYWQVFLEPKGDDRLQDDKWKEEMLEKLNDENLILIDENDDVKLVGIKFFASSQMDKFICDMQDKLNGGEPLEVSSLRQ